MPTPDLLESAGRRAALGPVPAAPSLDALSAEVDRRRSRHHKIVGGVAAALVVALAIPAALVLADNDQTDLVTLASNDGIELSSDEPTGLAAQVDPAPTTTTSVVATSSTAASASSTTQQIQGRGPFLGFNDENFDLRLDLGDESFSIAVISGDDAATRAAEAEASADETRQIDEQAVWIDNNGDEVTASALIDGETFVEVRGPQEQIDRILDLVAEHANGPVTFFDPGGFAEWFELPEGFFDNEGLFGDDFTFDAENFPFFQDGALDGLDLENLDLEGFGFEGSDLGKLFEGLTEGLEDATID